MPFPYRLICNLLQRLDDETRKDDHRQTPAKTIIESWFHDHCSGLHAPETDACAILSTLLPERRTDRVYCIQASRLESIFSKALILGASRVRELRGYRTSSSSVDLADCVEGILKRTPNNIQGSDELTVEEIDDTLSRIAAACRFSSPSVRALRKTQDSGDQDRSLTDIYRRLSARDAKWFTRLILKNYQPVVMDERLIFRCYHPCLPQLMKIRADFTMATTFLRQVSESPQDQSIVANVLKPAIGTKVGRQVWFKGRSIKHCLNMGRSREMSCEQKIDGEYCQIHIDLRKPHSPIQIFSKSGKDSTQDRIGLHQSIRDSLKLGASDCPLKTGCILEGEMVVYSTKDNRILPFHKIRKHVCRSGVFIGTNYDSQPHDYEHLMIVYYDVLLIDDESLLTVRQFERFKRLSELITCRKGYAELVTRETISFGRPSAASKLREAFAKCIVARGEGLVLKPDEPYFDFSPVPNSYCCNIKLKKEYVQGWGDVGDFAAVGASYNATKAKEYKRPNIKWTHFFIGCLENKEKARARTEKPRFIITNVVELPEKLLSTITTQCFPSPVPFNRNESIVLEFRQKGLENQMLDVFLEPLVFDMHSFSFNKDPNSNFWSMRFPTVSKIHHDRSYLDTISFAELQELASNATEIPELEDSQEMRRWISALEKADPRGVAVDASSQRSASSETRASLITHQDDINEAERARHSLTPNHIDDTPCGRPLQSHNDTIGATRVSLPPPKSSAVDAENYAPSEIPLEPAPNSACRKRPAIGARRTAKRPRRSSGASPEQSRSASSPVDTPPNTLSNRQPLGQIDANSSSGYVSGTPVGIPRDPLSDSSIIEMTTSVTGNDCNSLSEPSPCITPEAVYSAANPTPTRNEEESGQCLAHGCCSSVGRKCILANRSILLSPCISQYAWVTNSLLRDHGVDKFFTDPKLWSRAVRPNDFAYKWDASLGTIRKSRVRKICLVESKRSSATASFVRSIGDAGLKKKNGEREWVGVYDWRILEDISDIESGKIKLEGMDLWKKHYVGIA